jgi:long-chain acyl-CoA synthetase
LPVEHIVTTSLDDVEMNRVIERFAPAAEAQIPVSPEDIAYLVYTSGTTGSPKGAVILHRNVLFNAEVYRHWLEVNADDAILGMAPSFHITGLVAQLALSFVAGIPLILFHRFDPLQALTLSRKWKATVSVAAITAYIALLNANHAATTFLSKCYSGGAPVPPKVTEQFEKRFGTYIRNIYGLTESTSPSHAVPLGARAPTDPRSGALSIGVPLPNCEAKIVGLTDPNSEVPAGEAGELALRGPMMFAAYWKKPEATAAAFHDGFFLTGDVAVMDEEGWFYLVDRKKDMIVASGFKIWPREVEDTLYEHPAVREAAVVGVPDEYRGETVKAFVALKENLQDGVTAEQLIAFCKERIASYKCPREVEFVAEIPKTATGKFLRRALRS